MPVPSQLLAHLQAAEQSLLVATPRALDNAQLHLDQVVQTLTDQPELRRHPTVLGSVAIFNALADQAARLRMGRRNWSIDA